MSTEQRWKEALEEVARIKQENTDLKAMIALMKIKDGIDEIVCVTEQERKIKNIAKQTMLSVLSKMQ